MSQKQTVLNHLIDHGYITDLSAQSLRIRRLAARIHDLHRDGVCVKREVRKDVLGQRYTYYYLDGVHRTIEKFMRDGVLNGLAA